MAFAAFGSEPPMMRLRLATALSTTGALGLFVFCACNGLRSGPIDDAAEAPLEDGGNGDGGGSSSGDSTDAAAARTDAATPIDAEVDPEWAMSALPAPVPPAGNYSIANGVVKDEVTGLTWMQSALTADTHAGATTACAMSSLNGGDWRLPTRAELLSITSYSDKGINQDVFGGALADGVFWASTQDSASATFAWFVRFGVAAAITDDKSSPKNVRCVRGPARVNRTTPGAPRGHYIFKSPSVVYDVRTKLEWTRQPARSTIVDFEAALNACADLTLEGTQWRVPTARELESLFDVRAAVAPAWDIEAFGNPPGAAGFSYWTLTALPNLPDPYTHLGVTFRPSISTTTLVSATSQAFVRCVRGPK